MTKFELIIPSDHKDVFDACLDVAKAYCHKWCWALHPVDELSSFEHYHLGFFLPSNRTLDDILKWFADIDYIKRNSVEKIKKHLNTYMTYLMHKTKDAIDAGKSAPIEFGCSDNLDFGDAVQSYNENASIDTIIQGILDGFIRECDVYGDDKYLNVVARSCAAKSQVDNAFKAYYNSLLIKGVNGMTDGKERKQAWIYGPGGSGKTALAKKLIMLDGHDAKDIYVTSSGKNPFDNYMGQRAIIIDDIDSDTMTPKMALKLMDMFTGSAVAARYSNKVVAADTIYITSTISPEKWWALNQSNVDGSEKQLLRRLTVGCMQIKGTTFKLTTFKSNGDWDFEFTYDLPDDIVKMLDSNRRAFAINFMDAHFKRADNKAFSVSAKDVKIDGDNVTIGGGVQMHIDDFLRQQADNGDLPFND